MNAGARDSRPLIRRDPENPRIPRAVKTGHTAFVAVLVPVYARQYGPGNFLWFSDIALLASVPALWLESPLLASTQAVGVLVPETLWLADFSAGLACRRYPIGLASYMADRRLPRLVRGLSLFHLWLTPLLLLIIRRTGYDRRAFGLQTLVTWAVLLASWRLTRPEDNVNWVHSWQARLRTPRARAGFVLLFMAVWPLVFHLPAHRLLAQTFRPPDPPRREPHF